MANSDALLIDIKNKIQAMHGSIKKLKAEREELNAQIEELKTQLAQRENRIKDLDKNLELQKVANTVSSSEKNVEAKSKINEMVKEIDRCIAMLNS